MLYVFAKHVHVICVALSIGGFCLRGLLLMRKSALAGRPGERRWFRIIPHVNDAILLTAALTLAVMTAQYPFFESWLTAKVFGLIAYIILGSLALKEGRSARVRMVSGVAAVVVFGWIVSVALTRKPWGAFGLLA